MLLVFAHLLAASMALGAIVATDLRLLAKLAEDRVRIAPPNAFVARLVVTALGLLYLTGGALVWQGLLERPDYLANPKLQAKILFVVLLTLNAFVLHRLTFPRLARGRRVARWRASDWVVVAVPVAVSNFLWLFVAFLGVARPWNDGVPLRDILELAAGLYVVAQVVVFAILAVAGGAAEARQNGFASFVRRALASLGNLGGPIEAPALTDGAPAQRRRSVSSSRPRATLAADGNVAAAATARAIFAEPAVERATAAQRPALRLVGKINPSAPARTRVSADGAASSQRVR